MSSDSTSAPTPAILQSASTTSSDEPIELPRFIFMIGGDTDRNREFGELLLSRGHNLEIESMLEPLHEATDILFNLAPNDDASITLPGTTRNRQLWLTEFQALLESFCGPSILGETWLSISNERAIFDPSITTRIFLDANFAHATPFIREYGPKETLFLICGELKAPTSTEAAEAKLIWFPLPNNEERYKLLVRELEHFRGKS